jgi:hypothetical protein
MSEFQVLLQRNIFDTMRGAEPAKPEPAKVQQPVHQPRIETFSFRGAAETVGTEGEGFDAFFSGDGAPKTETLVVNDEINGFKVQEISLTEVKLMNTNHQVVTLKDQTGLTRRDGGPWVKVFVPVTYSTGTATRKPAANRNAQFSPRTAAVTDDNAGGYGGGYDAGMGGFNAQAGTAAPAAGSNPGVIARLQARRTQETQP